MNKINWIILKSKDRGIDYGVGTFIKQLSNGLAKHKQCNVFIIETGITRNKLFSVKQKDGITFIEIPVSENNSRTDTKQYQEKLSRNIARVVSQYIPAGSENIIHMNYLFQYFPATALKEVLNGKIIFTQHVFTMEPPLGNNYFDIEHQTYQKADVIATVTRHGKKHLTAKGVSPDKIKVIYNGIDPAHFRKQHIGIKVKYGLSNTEKIILYSGRLEPIKGLDYLSSAMSRLIKKMPGCRLVIAGNGNFENLIHTARNISANICYLGFIPFEDLVALYHEADIGVIPSLEEHCSYVALEMLHSGLPVVASKIGGLKEIFIHGENALLADTNEDKTNIYGVAPDVNQLERYMHTILNDISLRNQFSMKAKERAKMFTTETMITNYLKTIKNLNAVTYE